METTRWRHWWRSVLVLIALGFGVFGCADVFFSRPDFDNPHDPKNDPARGDHEYGIHDDSDLWGTGVGELLFGGITYDLARHSLQYAGERWEDAGTGNLIYDGETFDLSEHDIVYNGYRSASGTYQYTFFIQQPERDAVIYIHGMLSTSQTIGAGTYVPAAANTAGTFDWGYVVFDLHTDSETFRTITDGTIEVSHIGPLYTIEGTLSSDEDPIVFSYEGELYEDGNWVPTEFKYYLQFISSDQHEGIEFEIFLPSDSFEPDTFENSGTGEAGTFSWAEIWYDDWESWHQITGGTFDLSMVGSTHFVQGSLQSTGGDATFWYEGDIVRYFTANPP